ncbi:hypothetical protein LCGC14_2808210, partial [marine sediment metagenome]
NIGIQTTGGGNLDIIATLAQFNATPITTTGKITGGEVEINGNFNHDGSNIGFFGTAPTSQSTGWAVTNEVSDKVYDANSTSIDELADVLGTLIEELKTKGLLGA